MTADIRKTAAANTSLFMVFSPVLVGASTAPSSRERASGRPAPKHGLLPTLPGEIQVLRGSQGSSLKDRQCPAGGTGRGRGRGEMWPLPGTTGRKGWPDSCNLDTLIP